MARFLRVGDTIVNLDNIVAVDLHQQVYAKVNGKWQDVTDGVFIVTTAPATEGNWTLAFGGDDAERLRAYFEHYADMHVA